MHLPNTKTAGEVVHPHSGAHGPGELAVHDALGREDRDQERKHLDEMGSVAAQNLALCECFIDEANIALLEIADSAVHELR
ncbi:unannotated protein [freshwater metagenome]|uniref:Unannotated protein n=1 Tax=freshwater metagenome TaxID=449393 RepID=A0A6J6MQW2_9ZZZZ